MDKGLQPTRKWWVTQTTATAALLVAWVNVGAWDKTVSIAMIGFASQAVTSYLTPNHPESGGVPPPRRPASSRRRRVRKGASTPPLPAPRGVVEDGVRASG
jgi:hypothetical protein